MKIPDYIGYPGKQTSSYYGGEFSGDYDNIVDNRIVIAKIIPGKPFVRGDANIYEFENAWGDYVGDLRELNIDPPSKPELNIVISQLSPISRSYTNNYGDSKLLPTGNILGEAAQDIFNLTGGSTEEIEKRLKESDSAVAKLLGKGVGAYNSGVDWLTNLTQLAGDKIGGGGGNMIKGAGKIIQELAKSPQSKVGWPKMWRDCSFEQSYQLNTRLYCFSTNDKDDYDNNIRAAVAALELLVTPRSQSGALYTAPYIIDFDIPGMINFPQAYVSNMQVIEGGNEGDFAQTGRPNVVDITMTIQNMYSISVNTTKEGDTTYRYRPTVRKDLIGLSGGKNIGKSSTYNGGDGSGGITITTDEAISKQNQADAEAQTFQEKADTTGRQNMTDIQKETHDAIASQQTNIDNTLES